MMEHKVGWEALRAYCMSLLKTQGLEEDSAYTVADCLVDADLCGVESHGVSRMGIYLERLEKGAVQAKGDMKILSEYAGCMAYSAQNIMGMVAGKAAMQSCIEKARISGACVSTVRNSNHFGMASYYARMAADAGMIGFATTNAPPNIAPWGSSQPFLGTNPIAISAPTHGEPIILDMAPSVVAMGKVILAAKLGKSIPEGWAITADGRPTTDPSEGMKGSVLPIGGPKGYGIALFVDILCGILSGAGYGPHLNNMWNDFANPQGIGHFFMAIDIEKLMDLELFRSRLECMVREIKELPKQEGVEEIFMPGEIENRRRNKGKKDGIVLSEVVYNELQDLGRKYCVAFTL